MNITIKRIVNILTQPKELNSNETLFPFPVAGGHIIIHKLVAKYAGYLGIRFDAVEDIVDFMDILEKFNMNKTIEFRLGYQD
ncbi:hypothetical protein GW776_00005, partial [archaeon]|nr:hypothetical protein [archaeon]